MTGKLAITIKDPRRFIIQAKQQRLGEKWTRAQLIEELYLSLMRVKGQFCMLVDLTKEVRAADPKNHGNGVIRGVYEEQARYKMYRMPIFSPPPVFVVHLKDLDEKLKEELLKDNKAMRDFTLREAVGMIFEQIDSRLYLLAAKRFLKVELVD